jgi:hypothetical protein
MDLKIIVDLANIIVALGVLIAITQISINRKQLHFATIERCITEFRRFESNKVPIDKTDLIRYIDLINEELFYFQHNYLPKTIAYEWIDGMLDFVPIIDNRGNILNPQNCIPELAAKRNHFLRNYPRLKDSFIVIQTVRFDNAYNEEESKQDLRISSRKAIVEEIYKNVKAFSF